MSDILSLADTLEPNLAFVKGDLTKIAKIHVSFYKFYIRFASKCDALVFDKRSQDYLESCINFLENKPLTKKGIQQSRSNCLKMLDSLNDLCLSLGCDKKVLVGLHKLIDQAVVDDEGKGGGTLDLLKQLKNLLNDPGESADEQNETNRNDGRTSPANSTGSSAPEHETLKSRGGVEPMMQYLLSDSGMDSYYHKYNKDVKKYALTSEMNQIMTRASNLRENRYSGLDNLLGKMKINVPIWNYTVDRVDSIDSSNVMDNMEIFGGNKSVTDAVLYSCPEYLTVGPFDIYARNKVFVYHCLVNNCNNCMTTSLEFLKLHVKFQHGNTDIDWNCTACDLIKLHSSCQKSLDGALDHLAKHHSIKTTYTLSKERLMEINKKIEEDDSSYNVCPDLKTETFSLDNTDLFHCLNPECRFSTNSASLAFGHYMSRPLKGMAETCRYCPFITYSIYEFCDHTVKEHGNANYKCGYCPYRSVSKTNCVYHQRDLHSELPSKMYGIEPLPNAEYKYSCRAHNTIKPFVCNDSCNFGTMVEQRFNQHIMTHPGTTVTCHYCEKYHSDDMSELRDHFLIHGVGEYHCMYCKEAFNFISKVQQHLHEQHPSQYPFMIICQDFELRSHTLKGKYNKVQKLEIGGESIVVLPLESDKDVISTKAISESESILIEDVDHCKMQLKTFMKNKEEPEQEAYVSPLPHIEETLDLTASEDPKERVDIKPRLRVRTVAELIQSAQYPFVAPESVSNEDQAGYLGVATFHSFSQPMQTESIIDQSGPSCSTPMLTPLQIKQERMCVNDNEITIEREVLQEARRDNRSVEISAIQIKKEAVDFCISAKTSPKISKKMAKPPKPTRTVQPEPVTASTGSTGIQTASLVQCKAVERISEDQDAVAALISQETGRRLSLSDEESIISARGTPAKSMDTSGEIVTETHIESEETTGIPMEAAENQGLISKVRSLTPTLGSPSSFDITNVEIPTTEELLSQRPTSAISVSAASPNTIAISSEQLLLEPNNEVVVASSGSTLTETVINQEGLNTTQPILNAASIDNIPVDFDCIIPPIQDSKNFARDSEGNLIVRPQYSDPTVVDTVIISDGEDYDDVTASPVSTTPSTSNVTANPSLSPATSFISIPPTPSTSKEIVTSALKTQPKFTKISLEKDLGWSASQKQPTYMVINPRTLGSSIRHLPNILSKPSAVTAELGRDTTVPSKPTTISTAQAMARVETKRFRCKLCSFASEDRQVTYEHLTVAHPNRFRKQIRNIQLAQLPPGESIVRAVSCPYCPDVLYEGIKSFEKHHQKQHFDFIEVKCFLVYSTMVREHLSQLFACCFCGLFCRNEDAVWQHIYATHAAQISTLIKPLALKCPVAMKKMVCPLYNCLDEFLAPSAFESHVKSHTQVVACKKCTYIADSVEEFQKYHMGIDELDRVDHFYYNQSVEERANLLNVQRFSNPLYSLGSVLLREKTTTPAALPGRKTTARKSTGGAQYKRAN